MAILIQTTLAAVMGILLLQRACDGVVPHVVEPMTVASLIESDWASRPSWTGSVPASLYARAMTSLPPHYRGDLGALDAHLLEEHRVFTAEAPDVPRAHLCCVDYSQGLAFKSALTVVAAQQGGGVRSALNRAEGYCAIAHVSSATAATVGSEVHKGARCSPLTHASKEPASLLEPWSAHTDGYTPDSASFFGMKFGPSLQHGAERGLVVTMSPDTLPLDKGSRARGAGSADGPSRKLQDVDRAARSFSRSAVSHKLEGRWKSAWSSARARSGMSAFAESISWTSSLRRGEDGGSVRRLDVEGGAEAAADVVGEEGSLPSYHGAKVESYKAALAYLDSKMEDSGADGELGPSLGSSLAEACGWDKMNFVHGRSDVLYLRGIHDERHDEATGAACFLALVGFLSSQPDVLHIHPEARVEANNKVLTAYVEGGEPLETPMRDLGLNGTGEVIGITDTGLDDNSCFFRDEEHGMVPRSSVSEAAYYPEQRKVVQYLEYADDLDEDGHGTHVAGIACGAVYAGWKESWEVQVSSERCEDAGLDRSCFGDCISEMVGETCRWNPELSCPMNNCDPDKACDDQTGYPFPCFDNPEEELPAASGMAPAAKLSFFDIGLPDGELIVPNDLGEMFDAQYVAGVRVFSNSWSMVTQNEPTERDLQVDEWLYENQDSLVVFGAGNNGFESGRFQSRSVQSPATSKTVITVGCSNSGPDRAYAYYSDGSSGYDGVMSPGEDVDFEVSPYSARGPVGHLTAKPDVIAPGMMVHSAKASRSEYREETCALESYGGTSMSAPSIAGAAVLVRQYFSQGILAEYLQDAGLCDGGSYSFMGNCDPFEPSGYLLKAVLVNSAVWLGKMQTMSYDGNYEFMTVLDFAQGFGAVQLASGLPTANATMGGFFHDGEIKSNKRYYYLVYVQDTDEDLSLTLAWYDPPSTVSSYNLLHDLDCFAYSTSSETFYRANLFNTLVDMCGRDEACANKYEFTYENSLADDINSVERVVIPKNELEEGYYVLGVMSRSFTEDETQKYGFVATGGGLILHDTAPSWGKLGAETQAATGGWGKNSEEPDPDNALRMHKTYNPTSSPSVVNPMADGGDATSETPAPSKAPLDDAEAAIWSGDSSKDADDDEASSVEGARAVQADDDNDDDDGDDDATSIAAYPAVGGGVDSADTGDGGDMNNGGYEREVVGRDHDSSARTTIIIAASVAGAAAVIAMLTLFALRRRKDGHVTRRLTSDICARPFIRGGAVRISDGESVITVDDGHTAAKLDEVSSAYGQEHYFMSPSVKLPGYDTAVRISQDQRGSEHVYMVRSGGHHRDAGSSDEVGDETLDGADLGLTSEMSGFYAAVDPSAVAKLVGWGIGRDFARVALRQTDNDIPAALRMIAKGDMDARLALDQEEMTQQAGSDAVEPGPDATLTGVPAPGH